ncbi:MAG: transglutaminase-like cysteine peptidase [Pseudomonadota bacterium]|nr:transglutaminase-like cysteine peptidase [Pseudomonadota bacterium]
MAATADALASSLVVSAGSEARPFAPSFGRTLPPIGFVDFCGRNLSECEAVRADVRRAVLSAERWADLERVNSSVNASIEPVTDQELYAVPERWDYPMGAGDCEDFVLLKKRHLEDLGFPPESLLITVALDERGDGHAVLTVATDRGDFILDNRRSDVVRWSAASYRFLKRQSQADPRVWVALSQAGKISMAGMAKAGSKQK